MQLKTTHFFSSISDEWDRLFRLTPDASPFLDQEAMRIAVKYFYPYYVSWKCWPEFCCGYRKGECRVIMPLLRYSNGRTEIFGSPNGFNETGLVYSDKADIPEFLSSAAGRYGQIQFLKIDERSPLSDMKGDDAAATSNAVILFGDIYEEYFTRLSKSVRQNVRTAYNRVKSDGYKVDLQVFMGGGKQLPPDDIIDLYCLRHRQRYGVKTTPLRRWFLKHQNFATRFYRDCHNAMTFLLKIEGEPAAFMSGLWHDRRIIIPRLSINDEFRRYSPGMLLVCETIKYLAGNTEIKELDLSQGDEPYKYQLGATTHLSYLFKL